VVDGGGLGEDLLAAHGGEELGLGDAASPLFAQLRAPLAEVSHQFAQQGRRALGGYLGSRRPGAIEVGHLGATLSQAVRMGPRPRNGNPSAGYGESAGFKQ